jgi:hypothetical protein
MPSSSSWSWSPCQYRDALGKPRKGAHAIRIPLLDIAAIDVLLTLWAAWGIATWWDIPFWASFLGLLLLGIFFHWFFCVKTKINGFLEKCMYAMGVL